MVMEQAQRAKPVVALHALRVVVPEVLLMVMRDTGRLRYKQQQRDRQVGATP
jgi:hypothetical protein